MGSKRSVPILILLLHCQLFYPFLVSGDSPPAEAPADGPSPAPADGPLPAPAELSEDELHALQTVMNSLGFEGSTAILPSYCQQKENQEQFASAKCDCTFNNNTVCHITEIDMARAQLNGSIHPAIGELQYLQELYLHRNQLIGTIPESLGSLTNLEMLYLDDNQLTGTIPESLGNLTKLKYLYLYENQLTGTIPESLGNLTNLEQLDLNGNKLSGTIPNSLGNLKSLYLLFLYSNQLTGSIPWNLGTNIQKLLLHNNQLAGSISESLRSLMNLELLDLSHNYFNGPISTNFSGMKNLSHLDLNNNMLSGSIPEELGKLTELSYLDLSNNELNGLLPNGLGKLENLYTLLLTSNYFTGSIPQSFSKLTRLLIFSAGGNYLSGRIPNFIADWKELQKLNLLGNNFEGNLAEGIFNLTELQKLSVSGLRNPGLTFPKKTNMSSLQTLILRNCSINGTIPPFIVEWPKLQYLDLSFNNLIGEVPKFQNSNLKRIFLSRNMLNGTFPSWITEKQDLYEDPIIGDLSLNSFTKVPPVHRESGTVSNSQNTVIIEPTRTYLFQTGKDCHKKYRSLSINCGGEEVKFGKQNYENDTASSYFYQSPQGNWAYSLSGDYYSPNTQESEAYSFNGDYNLPTTNASEYIKNLTCGVSVPEAELYVNARAAPVSLTYYAFCLHQGKYNVKLMFAETSFAKREDYSELGKRVFDVYIQDERVLQDFNIKEEAGGANKELMKSFPTTVTDNKPLTIDFLWTGKGTLYNPPSLSYFDTSGIFIQSGPLISAISITPAPKKLSTWIIAVIVVACVLSLLILLAFMWRMGWIGDRELRQTRKKIGEKSFTVKEIIDATKKFSTTMKIGKDGNFGIVYKAELSNLTVAVKKLFPQSKAVAEIGTEVYAKTFKLEHDNLVQLLATYSGKDLHLLIYEYMGYGSLEQALFDPKSSMKLCWETRYRICLQIAQGLEYLHAKNPPIIHRNIKASNILLDETCKAKISDFGLAKLYEEDDPFRFIEEGGTRMYMAPEYATRKAVTMGIDVYSFGVLLLEIISGIKNDENLSKHHDQTIFLLEKVANLHAMVKDAKLQYKKVKYADLVDKKLLNTNYSEEEAVTIIDLAMLCTDQMASLRPAISDVVSVLEGKKTVEDVSKNKVKDSSTM